MAGNSSVEIGTLYLKSKPLFLPGVLIEGHTDIHAYALAKQRQADVWQSVTTADMIRSFPDVSASESLQRLPGISVIRDQGEGRYALLRGLEPQMTNILVNGEKISTGDINTRRVPLNIIPSSALSEIEVNKSLMPDMDADAIAGSINLIPKSAFDRSYARMGSLAGGFNQLRGNGIVDAQGSVASVLGQKHGLLAYASVYQTLRGSDDIEMIWGRRDVGSGPQYWIKNQELREYLSDRTTYGIGLSWDYRISSESSLYARVLYNRFHDDYVRRRIRLRYDTGTLLSLNDTSAVFQNNRVERETKVNKFRQSLTALQLGGRHAWNRLAVDGRLSFSRGVEWQPYRRDITFRLSNVNLRYNLDERNFPQYAVTNGLDIHDPANYRIRTLFFEDYTVTEKDAAASGNFQWTPGHETRLEFLKGGFKFRRKQRDRESYRPRYDSYAGPIFTMDQVRESYEIQDFLKDRYMFGPSAGPAETDAFLQNNFSNFVFNPGGTRIEDDPKTYDANETVVAGYAMASWRFGDWRLIPGLRVEKTYLNYRGNEVLVDGAGQYDTTIAKKGHFEYYYFFPGLHAQVEPSRQAKIRLSATRSLSRPDYYDLVPYRFIEVDEGQMSYGNPLLRPALSTNLDASVDYYLDPSGLYSAGVFYKRIRRFIVPRNFVETTGPFAGFQVFEKINGKRATVWGMEFSVQRRFTELPGLLAGLGVMAGYTYAQSSAHLRDSTEAQSLPGQSDHTWNASALYDWRRFSARLSAAYHSDFLYQVNTGDPALDVYFGSHFQLDIAASYRVTTWLTAYADAVNLTNAPLVTYAGTSRQKTQQEFYSWWTHAGFRFHF